MPSGSQAPCPVAITQPRESVKQWEILCLAYASFNSHFARNTRRRVNARVEGTNFPMSAERCKTGRKVQGSPDPPLIAPQFPEGSHQRSIGQPFQFDFEKPYHYTVTATRLLSESGVGILWWQTTSNMVKVTSQF